MLLTSKIFVFTVTKNFPASKEYYPQCEKCEHKKKIPRNKPKKKS